MTQAALPAQEVSLRPLRVLIVDDNVDAAEMLGMVLESAGHQVTLAFTGAAAIAQATGAMADVFLLDVGLPDMSGHALAVRLRAMDGAERATMIAITGYGDPACRAASRAAGIEHHLTKPVDAAVLERLLAQAQRRAN